MKPQFKNGKACGEQARYGVVTDYAGLRALVSAR